MKIGGGAMGLGAAPFSFGADRRNVGFMQIHASCAARSGAAVIFLGPSGSGKSDLVFRLLDRGFDLVADDRVDLVDGWVSPPEPLAGLIELRGLGLVRIPYVTHAHLTLVVELGAAPRLPEPRQWDLHPVPLVAIDPRTPSAPQLVEWALDCAQKRKMMIEGALA
jgi:HPr kinase/phosphorylase